MLLTTLNNVGSKILFNAVFNSHEQVVRFRLCIFKYNALVEINIYNNLFPTSLLLDKTVFYRTFVK